MGRFRHPVGRALAGTLIEGGVVETTNPQGRSAVVLACEHATNFIPDVFGNLGLSDEQLQDHIAWDPGALAVARKISAELDATLIAPRISRLVYDCNRPPSAESAVPAVSEAHEIPGNSGLNAVDRQVRVEAIYRPFRKILGEVLDDRLTTGLRPALVTVHSFTPVYKGETRDVELGILCDDDTRLAEALLRVAATSRPEVAARLNQPYGPADGVTHTLADQALPRGLLNVMIEIRNDLIDQSSQQEAIGQWLADCLRLALDQLEALQQYEGEGRSAGS